MGVRWAGQSRWAVHEARTEAARRRGARLRRWRWAVAHLPWNVHAQLWLLIVVAGALLAGWFWVVVSSGWQLAEWLP